MSLILRNIVRNYLSVIVNYHPETIRFLLVDGQADGRNSDYTEHNKSTLNGDTHLILSFI
jgi:hypothetical protein